jgi:hypothetical protein
MDCCGHGHVKALQPWVWSTPLVSVGAMLAGEVAPRGSTAAAQTHRHHVKGAAEPRSRRRDVRGIAGRRLPRRRAGLASARTQPRGRSRRNSNAGAKSASRRSSERPSKPDSAKSLVR